MRGLFLLLTIIPLGLNVARTVLSCAAAAAPGMRMSSPFGHDVLRGAAPTQAYVHGRWEPSSQSERLGGRTGPRYVSTRTPYAPSVTGQVAGFRLSGVEPDGDPLYQVVLQTTLSPSGDIPSLHLIISSYLENFKPDTTPILPDLLHPTRNAANLGGFLEGKALLTDNAGDALYVGSFLAEAFLNNSNHTVMRFYGTGAARSGSGSLKGTFSLRKSGTLSGALTGRLTLPPAARRQIEAHRTAKMKPVQEIIRLVTVRPAPMRGKSTAGSPLSTPLPTGFGSTPSAPPQGSAGRRISPWTAVAGIGALVSLLLAAYLFWADRRTRQKAAGPDQGSPSAGP